MRGDALAIAARWPAVVRFAVVVRIPVVIYNRCEKAGINRFAG
jgi:hypothetical protein